MKIGRLNRASFAKTARRAMFLFAFAALGAQAAMVAKVGETAYETLEAAIAAAEPVDGVVTYEICGKAEVSATGWIQVLKSGLSNVKKVAFVGTTKDAEICIAGGLAILADQQYDIDVSFRNLKLSKPNPEYGGDYGHSTNYFTTWLRNTGAAENTVTYENCTFPNGACNNQYGKTVYTNCTFANGTTGLYNLWIYGGSVEMDGGVFTGTRGMKVYTEGTPATAPSVEVKRTAFSGLTEKAAIVVSKAATVKFAEVSVADCSKGLFQKDIEGSLDDQKVTVTANGSKISGSFAITANREPETAKTEFNITGGMFTAEVPSDYCADGFTVKATTDADGNTVYGVVEKTELVNYVTLELVFGDNVADEDVVAAKALYAQEKYETCKAANEAYMALFGVTWGKGYLDVTDNTAPLYKYAGRSGSVSEVRFYIHGTLAGFTSLQSSGNQIDCTVGGNHQISRTSYSIIGVDGADGKAKLTDGNVQAYVAGGYASMFTASGKLTIDNIEFTSTTSTTVGASAMRATESDTENEVASAEMEIKNCTFRGRLYVYDNFENQGKMTYSIHNCVFDGSNYSGDSNAYAIFAQCKGGNNLVIKDNAIAGFARGINIDHANVHATIEGNTISVTDTGRSCIQLSSLATANIVGNTLELTGGNAITLHEKLLTLGVVPVVSISGNTVTGTGYLIYDDAKANDKEFTSDNLKLTYATDNTVAATVDTTQGVKDATKYELSGTVATTLHSVDFAAFVKALTDEGYTFDGSTHALAQNGKLTVKWSPKSGCYDNRGEGHECTVGNVAATANTPKRVNSGLTQFQLFEGESHAVNVKNVAFVYEPAAFTVCENSGWKGSFTADDAPAGQIFLMNTGDVTFEGCSFDKVVLTSFNCTGTSTVKDCSFKNVYNSYAVKDIRGATISVTGCTFENCGAAVMVSSTVKVGAVTISGNTFTKVDVAGTTPDNKVGTRGLVQIAFSGDYADTKFDFSGNTATDCGPVLRQLNSTVSFDPDDKTDLGKLVSDGGASTFYTDDTFVARVGDTKYATLAEAFAALNAGNHTLTLLKENAWDATTPVYWAAGAQSGYAATLTDALTAAYKAYEGAITIVCRPGADVGEMTHGHVADDLTIYGNDAYLSGGECDLEVDTYTFSRATGKQAADGVCLDKDITITAYELDNLGVWGERHTANKVTVNLTDCDGKALEGKTNVQRVYISGTTGVNDITLTDCGFLTKATAVYSNADGAIKAVNCSFTGGEVPFNINHKANGTQTVAVENCTFTNCGDAGDWKQFAAPLRLVNSGTGTQSAEVTGCAFAGTVGANGDILLGDGRTGQASNDVELKVVNTAANIQAQKPGYYGGETVDATKMAMAVSPADGTLETSVAKLLPVDPRTLGYATSGKAEALPATPDMNGEVVNVTAAQAQYVLDGAYGPIDGKTINFTESINDTLILGRASKYDGSKTVYRHGSHAGEALSYADFIAYKNQSVWTESCYYERTVENVTFTANEGVTVKNFEADGGAHIYAGTAPVYDYVRDTGSWVTEGSCYFKRAILQNITFKGLTFKAKTDINTSESTTVYDGFTFKDCTFDLGTTADGNQAIRYYNENNNGNVKNLVVDGCTFKTCSQGVYTMQVKGITVKDSTFTQTGHNAIAIQSQGEDKGPCNHGEVVITGNTFKNIGDRIIRFNNVGLGTTVTITGNTADGYSGKLDEATGKREIVKATTLPVNAADSITASGNNWGANTVVEGVFIDDYATKLGTEACPYSREQFAAMTRADYIKAQKRLGGTLYVNVGNYAYEKNGVLGNGVRDDTPGQVPDHSKLNAYGENGYLGEKNDGANGHAVVFVGGTITSGVTGYTSIDNIGTSLLLAVPAYTKVTFKETAFKNVLSFNYQLYTSPWSQLGGLTFKDCTFDGIIVGAIASQELAFNGCTFNNYVNTTDANSSNPTWIRPAYGNWTKGDNAGQGTDFRSLTKITFENNTVTSTRPVKFERIAQWEMATTVTATNNTFAITPQEGDKEEKTKNVGLYFGANAKFNLVIDENKKSDETAALYTAVYLAPTGGTYAGLPAGSTVKNTAGEVVTTEDALAWKTTKKITLKTTEEVASVTNANGVSVNFATLAEAIVAAKDGETVKLLADVNGDGIAIAPNTFKTGLTVDFGGHTYTVGGLLVGSSGTVSNGFQLNAGNKITFKNGTIVGATATAGAGTDWKGAPAILIQNYCDLTLEQMTVKGGDETCYTLSNNNGEIVIDGSTIVAGKGTKLGPFAFDVCRYASYPSVHVTVKGASVIEGDVEISGTIGDNQSRQLDIEGGTFKGAFTVVGNIPANIAISGGTFATAIDETYCATGFIPTKNADGTYGVKEGAYVAEIGTVKYETVDAAMEAAAANETATTVKLLAESVDETVVPTWYIKGDVTVDADSAVKATFAPIENAADAPDTDGMAYIASDDAEKARTITVGEKVTLSFPNTAKETGAFYIGYGKDGNWAPTHLVLNGRIEAYEPYIGAGSSLTVSKTGSLKSLSECLLMRRGSTVTVTGTDGAWSAEKPQVALGYGSQQGGEVTFKDTFVTGGAFWTMWNRNGNADVATKLTLDNTAFTAGAFKGTASSGETSAYQVELKNGAKMTIAGDFGVIAEGSVTIEAGSLIIAKSIANAGTFIVDATGITAPVKVFDYTGTVEMTLADYGTVNVVGGEAYVEDGDLWVRELPVAKIGETVYGSIADAVVAAQGGDTVTLLTDVALTEALTLDKDLTLDLGGKTVTAGAVKTTRLSNGGCYAGFVVNGSAQVAVKNGTLTSAYATYKDGTTSASYSSYVVLVDDTAHLTLDGVCVVGQDAGDNHVRASGGICYDSTGSLTLKSCTVSAGASNGKGYNYNNPAAIFTVSGCDGTLVVDATTVTGGAATGIKMDKDGSAAINVNGGVDVTVSNGSKLVGGGSAKTAGNALEARGSGTLKVSDSTLQGGSSTDGIGGSALYVTSSTVTAEVTGATLVGGDGGTSWDGSGVVLNEAATVTITDSTVKSGRGENATGNAAAITLPNWESANLTLSNVSLSGSDRNTVIKNGLTDGIKLAGDVTVDAGTLKNVAISELGKNVSIRISEGAVAEEDTIVSLDPDHALVKDSDVLFRSDMAVAQVVDSQGKKMSYATLASAIAAAEDGETVKLLADVVLTEKQTIAKAVVLDLNGKTISSMVNQFITIAKGGDLTVNDATGEGRIENTVTESWGGTIKMTGGVLTVNGGTIAANSATSEYSPTIEADTSSSATINVMGGRIEADRTGNARAINLRAQANVTLNVTGGEIVGSQNGIYSFAGNTINISAGVVAGKAGSAVYSSGKNRVLISGGTLTPSGTASALYISMGSSATVTIGREGGKVDDVTIPSIDVGDCTTTVTLLSGTVRAFKNWDSMTVEKVSQGKDTLLVGTDITACLPGSDLLCQLDAASGLYEIVKLTVENAAAIVTHDDVETPYHTVEQACKAVTEGDTLTLKVDHTGSQTLSFSAKNVTVDLGGKTLTYTGATGGLSSALSFNQSTASDNTVTVKNGTIVAKAQDAACVRAEMTGDLSKTLTVVFGENLTLTSGNTSRYGGVVFGTGARTASPCEKMTKGGLLVTEGEEVWIYGETATAFTHAKGSEVTLLNDWYDTDTKGTVKVPSSGTFASAKLNLNGHTINSYGVNPAVLMGMVGENEDTAAKTLEISSGTIKTFCHGAAVCGSNKTLTLDGVTLTTTGDKMYGLYANGMTSGNTVTLKNKSAVLSEKATGIYFPGAGTLTVEDSNVTGGVSGIEVRAGVLNVSGTSVIASTAMEFSFTNNDNGTTTTGAAVAAVKHTVGNDLAVTITGGTFKGPRGFYANDPNVAKPGKVTVSISGGVFSTDVEKKYLADGSKTVQQTIDGTLYYVVGPAITQIGVTLGGEKKEMPFTDAWLADNIGADASSWTTAALEEKAANGLAKWQCYLFGLDPSKEDAKVVATAGQGTDEAIPLAVANADASASPLVTGGYVTVAYVLMGSNDGTVWTQVATSNKRDGLEIPLTGTTYKFYRVDVTVTSAEGN